MKTKIGLCLMLLASCKAGQNANKNQNPQTNRFEEFQFEYKDVAPTEYGQAWKRVWKLSGDDVADVAVDEIEDNENSNWKEVARTNENGIYIQTNTTRRVKLRFDGTLVTDWINPTRDLVVNRLTQTHSVFQSWRCVVPPNALLYVSSGGLTFRCHEVIVAGVITAFGAQSTPGPHAGEVEINANIIRIPGKITLDGEAGSRGATGRHDLVEIGDRRIGHACEDGDRGGTGGNGGHIKLVARDIIEVGGTLRVLAGPGGRGGEPGWRTCKEGPRGKDGQVGIIEKIIL